MEIQMHALEPGFVCLRCRGIISGPPGGKAHDPLDSLFNSDGWSGLVLLDLQSVDYIDSLGINWLVHWQRRAKKAGGNLGLCAVPPRVDDVLRLCQLHRVLPIWPDEPAARAALRAARAAGNGVPEPGL